MIEVRNDTEPTWDGRVAIWFKNESVENKTWGLLPEAVRAHLERFVQRKRPVKDHPRAWVLSVDPDEVSVSWGSIASDAGGVRVKFVTPEELEIDTALSINTRASPPIDCDRYYEIKDACRSEPKPRQFWWGDELGLDASDAGREWLWNGLIDGRGITLLTALWKSGKTTLLNALLRHLTADGAAPFFLGRPCGFGRGYPASALVVSEESRPVWHRRTPSHRVAVWSRPLGNLRPKFAHWEAFISTLRDAVNRYGFDLAVFDGLASLWPVHDENDASQVTRALSPLRQLGQCGVVLVHHCGKDADLSSPVGVASRGSGALPAFVDGLVELSRGPGLDLDDRRRVIRAGGRHPDTFGGHLWYLLTESGALETCDPPVVEETRNGGKAAQLLAVAVRMAMGKEGVPLSLDGIAARLEGAATVQQLKPVLLGLVEKGMARQTGKGVKGDPFRFELLER